MANTALCSGLQIAELTLFAFIHLLSAYPLVAFVAIFNDWTYTKWIFK